MSGSFGFAKYNFSWSPIWTFSRDLQAGKKTTVYWSGLRSLEVEDLIVEVAAFNPSVPISIGDLIVT